MFKEMWDPDRVPGPIDSTRPVNEQISDMPYNPTYEVDPKSFKITEHVLGIGQFGKVVLGMHPFMAIKMPKGTTF